MHDQAQEQDSSSHHHPQIQDDVISLTEQQQQQSHKSECLQNALVGATGVEQQVRAMSAPGAGYHSCLCLLG